MVFSTSAYLCHGDVVCTHVSGIDARLPLFRRDDYFLQLIVCVEGDVQCGICCQAEAVGPCGVTQVGGREAHLTFGQGQGIEAVGIRGRPHGVAAVQNVGTYQCFGRGGVGDVAAHGKASAFALAGHLALAQHDVLARDFEFHRLVAEGLFQYLADGEFLYFQVDAAGESDFVAIDEGIARGVLQLGHQRTEGGVADVHGDGGLRVLGLEADSKQYRAHQEQEPEGAVGTAWFRIVHGWLSLVCRMMFWFLSCR